MDLGDIAELAKTFGPGPALIIVAIVAGVLLVPVFKRERSKSDVPLVTDREVLEFMARQGEININLRYRVRALESKHGRDGDE